MTNRYCTFLDQFKSDLEAVISQGGDADAMVEAVNAYQDGYPSIRAPMFREWLGNELFMCERCDHEFKADTRATEEDHLVLCRGCADGQRIYDEAIGRRR